jgi:hypothetical protein
VTARLLWMSVSPMSLLAPRSFYGVLACALAAAAPARAQVHWDSSAEVGVEKRFLNAKPAGAADAGFGPVARVGAHFALLPLIRVGGYGSFAFSPITGASARLLYGGGLELRLVPPIRLPSMHAYVFTGIGYMGARATARDGAPAAGGGCIDVPLGFALSYRVRKPVEIGAALGSRFSAACNGSLYNDSATPAPNARSPYAGTDIFALNLSLLFNVEL